MKERKKFLIGNQICLAHPNALLDSKPFMQSRSDYSTLEKIGETERDLSYEAIFNEMQYYESLECCFPNMIWIILAKSNEKYLGDISFSPLEHGHGYSINILITPNERNKGYGSEAIILITNYLLQYPLIKKIYVQVYINNPNAFYLFNRLGFSFCHLVDLNYNLSNKLNRYAYLLSKSKC